jgi:hypothetical protein
MPRQEPTSDRRNRGWGRENSSKGHGNKGLHEYIEVPESCRLGHPSVIIPLPFPQPVVDNAFMLLLRSYWLPLSCSARAVKSS